ncbi:hypothetical protein [Roseomonas sp. WA12]
MILAARPAIWLAPLAIAAYILRFLSSWLLLERVGADRFDPHAFGLLGDGMLLLALTLPLLLLLWWILGRRRPWRGLFAHGRSGGWTVLSVLLLLLVGSPTPGQAWAFIMLPFRDHWPVLLAALLWFATCAVLRALAVTPPEASR